MAGIVVVGAGQAGASLVAKLRSLGYADELTLIGGEPVLPYQRPPLSKGYLIGDIELDRLFLRPASFYSSNNINLRLGEYVTDINAAEKKITVGGETLGYSQLALATGSQPRHLPAEIGGKLDGVYSVRGLADVDAMAPEFLPGRRVLIVGGGYIGLEAAAVSSKLGLDVALVEIGPRILERVAAPETSQYFRALHQAHGVRIIEGDGLKCILGTERVNAATLTDGQELPVDFVIVGIGIAPALSLAENAGLQIENGIRTDAYGRTSDQSIWAAGDCCSFPWRGRRIRLESVGHAIEQAECVAENMLGAKKSYVAKPWFWSDQYDVKLQIAGLNAGYDRSVRRNGGDAPQSIWYFKEDQLLAVDAMNDPRSYMVGKKIIEADLTIDQSIVANNDVDVKEFLTLSRPAV